MTSTERRGVVLVLACVLSSALRASAVHPIETQLRSSFPNVPLDSQATFAPSETAVNGRAIRGLRATFPHSEPPAATRRGIRAEAATQQTLAVQYPRSYDEPMVVESGRQRLVLRATGAAPSFVSEIGGKLLYERPYPFTDTIEVPRGSHSEELLLLHDPRAPRVYEWEILEAHGISAAVLDGGAIRFVSDAPKASRAPGSFTRLPASLQIDRPWVIDATGTRFESAAEWTLIGDGPMPKTIRLSLTNDRLAYPLLIDPSFSITGSMLQFRHSNTTTLLPNGKVLVTGGWQNAYLASAELYDPATGTFTAAGNMTAPRSGHSATLLPNGKVFIAGGENASGFVLATELYDPVTGTFTAAAMLPQARSIHTATLLKNGKVLLVDGPSADLYDPATGTFGSTISLVTTHYDHTATLLQNGKVLIAGGYFNGNLSAAELYDPAANSFTATGSLVSARLIHTATVLANGNVLVAGGQQLAEAGSTSLDTAELYDPVTGTFTLTGSMEMARWFQTATLLPNGKALLVAGFGAPAAGHTAELYDPVSGTFSSTGDLVNERGAWHTATLLPNGRVLILGGSIAEAELYEPDEGSFNTTGSFAGSMRNRHTSTLLPNGKVLIAGGSSGFGNPLGTAELFDPASGTFTGTGNLGTARFAHTATLLATGKVLIIGGYGPNTLSAAELYDPSDGTFTPTGSLEISEHTATLLPSGKVLVIAGTEASLYDPSTGTFTATGTLGISRLQHSATLLATGKVLITGGYGPPFYNFLNSVELYDPITGTFAPTGDMVVTETTHTATLLPNGKVLIVGAGTGGFAELYDPTSGSFSETGSLFVERDGGHSAVLLRNGKVLIAGGYYGPDELNSAELYDPASESFSETGNLNSGRRTFSSTLLPNGKVLIAGGETDAGFTTSAELFDAGQGFAESRRPVITSAPSSQTQPATMSLTGTAFRGDSESASGTSNASASNVPLLHLQRIDNDQTLFVGPSASWTDTSFTSGTLSGLPAGHYRVSMIVNGIPSMERLISFANPGPPPQISINDVTVTEGNSGTTTATFTVSLSAPGGAVTVNYATANGTATAAPAFSNPAFIDIPVGGNAIPYPSTINVSGISGTVTKVTARLTGYTHNFAGDVDVLLVGPGGQSVVLMSDAGSSSAPAGLNLTFDDTAAAFLPPAAFTSGAYKPTNIADGEGDDSYPSPAPPSGYASALSVFNAVSPNGTWSLYVVDDFASEGGMIAGGWSLTFSTKPDYISSSGTLSFPMGTTSQTISIAVTGDTSLETNETFFVNLSGATNATILDAQGQGTITNDDSTPDAPENVVAAATSTTAVNISWSAAPAVSSYRVYRGQRIGGVITYSLVGSPGTTTFNDATASPGVAYLYKVRSFASIESADSNLDLATTVMFTDPTLTSITRVKLVHFTQLLTAVNAVRTLAGLAAASFSAPAPAIGVTVRAQHVNNLRSGLTTARSALALPSLSFTDPTLTTGVTKLKTVHLTELRNGVN